MSTPPFQPQPHPANEFDRDWKGVPLHEIFQLDALCDRFEQSLERDPDSRIETLIADLTEARQHLAVRELVPLEIEWRKTRGQRLTPDEFAGRFPQWADELREIASSELERLDRQSSSTDQTHRGVATDKVEVLTRDEFSKRLSDCGILSSADLQSLLNELPAGDQPVDAAQLAWLLIRRGLLTSYQAKQVYRGEGSSLILGNYVILDKIGLGGMGLVLKARHTRMKRVVALKVLSPQVTKSPEVLRRFEREVEAAAQLNHPNIVTAHDADEAKDTHFLVMEFVEGIDLAKLVREFGRLPVGQAVDCVVQAARGLGYAHSQGVVHRDIKPGNLLLDTTGTVKVLDMGLARLTSAAADQDQLTGVDQIMGTVDFMAPEQARSTKNADARADIYSLGMTLWFLLTGKEAYAGSSPTEKLLAHQADPVPSLIAARPDVPANLAATFSRMVAKQPDDRFQTMAEVIAALEESRPADAGGAGLSNGAGGAWRQDSEQASVFGSDVNAATEMPHPPSSAPAGSSAFSETVRLASADLDSDPQSQTLPSDNAVVSENAAVTMSRPPRGPWSQNRIMLAAAAGAAAVLLLGLIIIRITRKDGSTLEVTVPDDVTKVEISESATSSGFDGRNSHSGISQPDTADSSAWGGWPKDAPPPAIAPFNAAQATQHQQAWADYLKLPVEYTNSVGMKFRLIPPGEFLMGVEPGEIDLIQRYFRQEHERPEMEAEASRATPRHRVRLTRPYYLQTHEVTFALFQQILGRLPAGAESEKLDSAAINYISLSDAVAFCDELSKREEKSAAHHVDGAKLSRNLDADGYRLPTEAEWAFACRAGTTTVWFFGDDPHGDGEDISSILKEYQTGWHGSAAKANPFGLFDMYAGSDELCFDRYLPYRSEDLVDPFTDPGEGRVVTRGGTVFAGSGGTTSLNNSFSRRETLNLSHGFSGFGRVLLPIPLPPATPVWSLTESPLVE